MMGPRSLPMTYQKCDSATWQVASFVSEEAGLDGWTQNAMWHACCQGPCSRWVPREVYEWSPPGPCVPAIGGARTTE